MVFLPTSSSPCCQYDMLKLTCSCLGLLPSRKWLLYSSFDPPPSLFHTSDTRAILIGQHFLVGYPASSFQNLLHHLALLDLWYYPLSSIQISYFYLCTCLCVCVRVCVVSVCVYIFVHVCILVWVPVEARRTGITRSCEPPDEGAGNETLVLWENRGKCLAVSPAPLSSLRSFLWLFYVKSSVNLPQACLVQQAFIWAQHTHVISMQITKWSVNLQSPVSSLMFSPLLPECKGSSWEKSLFSGMDRQCWGSHNWS